MEVTRLSSVVETVTDLVTPILQDHDFYLYDWHQNAYIGRLHGLHHPAIALKNASMRYPLTPTERNIIETHMWPLTLFHIPGCRAAVIVCIADKICSAYETVSYRIRPKHHPSNAFSHHPKSR